MRIEGVVSLQACGLERSEEATWKPESFAVWARDGNGDEPPFTWFHCLIRYLRSMEGAISIRFRTIPCLLPAE